MVSDAIFTAKKDATFVASPDIQYDASLSVIDGLKRIVLRGVCLDTSVNRNNWQIPVDELEDVAKRSINAQVRIDHSNSIRDVKGRIIKTEIDEPHDFPKENWDLPNSFPHIHYEAEVVTNDANILIPVLQGYVDHVSIGVDSKTVFCSSCGKSTRPGKECDCENSWEIVKNARVNEYSIVCSPAYEGAFFKPFAASEKEKKSECECEEEEKVKKVDRVQEISSVEEDNEVASVETDDTLMSTEEEEKLEASDNIIIENEKEDADNMGEEFEELKAMVEKLAASTADLIASNGELLTRIAAIEAEEEEEEDDKKKAKKAGNEGAGTKEAAEDGGSDEEASDEEAAEDGEEKVACGCGGKKASKKKASSGMKETPGERGDPPGEEKKPTIKKSPIEAGIVTTPMKSEVTPSDSMGKAISEVFKFAANRNVFPIE
jgi:hypothetical protein